MILCAYPLCIFGTSLSSTFASRCGISFHVQSQPGYLASAGYPNAVEHSKVCDCRWYVHIPNQFSCSGPTAWCWLLPLQLKVLLVAALTTPASGLLDIVLTTWHMPRQSSPRAPASLPLSLSELCSWVIVPPPCPFMPHRTSLRP